MSEGKPRRRIARRRHRHQLKFLAKCPNCEAPFKIPALWEDRCCHKCRARSHGKIVPTVDLIYLLAAAKNIVQQNADTTFSTLEPIHG
ncbi:hypothetical protein [Nostoc sp.]|uniref:hypothetical protein n=1 Tax=Nostoc sp. TaxID=1180 RepID=UPI002FF4CA12